MPESKLGNFQFPHGWTIVIGVVLCLVYSYYIAFKSQIEIDMEITTSEVSFLQVYWADHDEEFSEQRARKVRVGSNKSSYRFLIGGLGSIDHIRIDPMELRWRKDPAEIIKLNSLKITQLGYKDLIFQSEKALSQLKPLSGLKEVEYRDDGLYMETTDNDSQLLLSLAAVKTYFFPIAHLFNFLLIVLITFLIRPCIAVLKNNLVFVPIFLLAVLLVVLAMATITNYNAHPDEFTQLFAVEYYSQHLFPPAMNSPEIAHTFSDYGQTRLASFEIYYQIAGIFTRLLQPFNLPYFYDARIFSVLLLVVLLYLSICFEAFRYFALPLLISPQVWYLFSYSNSDCFALFITTILVYQAAHKNSGLNQFLERPNPPQFLLSVFGFGLLIGTMLLLKSNFYIVGLFLLIYLFWRLGCGEFPDRKRLAVRIALLVLVATSVYGIRWGADVVANGFDRTETFEQLQIEKAKPLFNPTTPLENTDVFLRLRDKGMPLDFLTQYLHWGKILFSSSFGSYGYTQYNGSDFYYSIVKNLAVLLLLSVIFLILIKGPTRDHYLLAIVLLCASILILSSLAASWIMNFQPQGRYMAPILPMVGVLLYHVRQYSLTTWTVSLITALWVLSVFSFLFVGLAHLPKAAGPFT